MVTPTEGGGGGGGGGGIQWQNPTVLMLPF